LKTRDSGDVLVRDLVILCEAQDAFNYATTLQSKNIKNVNPIQRLNGLTVGIIAAG